MGLPALALPVFFIVPIIGLILGIVYKTKHLPVGKGLSTAGIITSSLGLVLPILLVVLFVVLFFTNVEFRSMYLNQLKEYYPDMYEEFYNQFSGQFPEWFENILYYIFK